MKLVERIERPRNMVRFDMFKNKKTLMGNHRLFDGLCIPAHLKSYFSNATASFLYEAHGKGMPFFIDPMTYVFQRPPTDFRDKNGNLKQSIGKLANDYGGLIKNIFLGSWRQLKPSDFEQGFGLDELIKRCFFLQTSGYSDVVELINKYGIRTTEPPQPDILVAPYFYFKDTGDSWLKVNKKICGKVREFANGRKVFSVIVTDFDAIGSEIEEILQAFSGDVDGFFLWISHDRRITKNQIKMKRRFISALKERNPTKNIFLLYGSFCSIPLFYDGLAGYCHGPLYSEHKNINQMLGGGPAPKRYYVKKLHDFLETSKISQNAELISDIIKCDCEFCSGISAQSIDRLLESQLISHFLNARRGENSSAGNNTKDDFMTLIENDYDVVNEVVVNTGHDARQLKSIIDAFTD